MLNKPRIEQNKALIIAHGIKLAFGEKPDFHEMFDDVDQVTAAENEWKKAESERKLAEHRQNVGGMGG